MRTSLAALAMVAILLVAGVAPALAVSDRVSGGGKLVLPDGSFETYGFTARIDGRGMVRGQGQIQIHGDVLVHFVANCLSVDGDTAWLGGVVTRTSETASVPVGTDITWQLQDNGEGAHAAPDLQSFIIPTALLATFGLGTDCTDRGDLFSLGAFEWLKGNVEIG